MSKILDLTDSGYLDDEFIFLFEEICVNNKKNFNTIIENITNKLEGNIDWLLSLPFSRNTLISDIFKKYCYLILILEILKKNIDIKYVLVDCPYLEYSINKITKIRVRNILRKNENFLTKISKNYVLFKYLIFQIIFRFSQILIYKFLSRKNKTIINKELFLIDTFVIPGFLNKDRYYNNILNFVDLKLKNKFFFVPILAYTKYFKLFSSYNELINSNRNFLFREEYLKFKDIVYSILYCLRIKKINIICKCNKYKFDLTDFFLSELSGIKGTNLAIEGYLNYFFIKRINDKKIKLKLVINWWENQSIDKGLNLGVNQFYPEVETIGYLGYAPREFELQLSPTKYEKTQKILPNKIAVIGKKLVNTIKEFDKDIDVIIGPAFRYQYLWDINKSYNQNQKKYILIALPITFQDSKNILSVFFEYYKINKFEYKVFIKLHPTMNVKQIYNHFKQYMDKNISLVSSDNINEYIIKADIVISAMSIVCLEALSLGIPTIVIRRRSGLSFNPVPKDIPKDIYKICKNYKELQRCLIFFKEKIMHNNVKINTIGKKIKEMYFEPVNNKTVKNFLNITN